MSSSSACRRAGGGMISGHLTLLERDQAPRWRDRAQPRPPRTPPRRCACRGGPSSTQRARLRLFFLDVGPRARRVRELLPATIGDHEQAEPVEPVHRVATEVLRPVAGHQGEVHEVAGYEPGSAEPRRSPLQVRQMPSRGLYGVSPVDRHRPCRGSDASRPSRAADGGTPVGRAPPHDAFPDHLAPAVLLGAFVGFSAPPRRAG